MGPVVSLDSSAKVKQNLNTARQELDAFKSALNKKEFAHLRPILLDVEYMLKAKYYEEKKYHRRARNYWFKAMKIAQGTYGKIAFKGWLNNIANDSRIPKSAEYITTIIEKQSDEGSKSIYMIKNDLTDFDSIYKAVTKYHPKLKTNKTYTRKISIPKYSKIIHNDPLLTKTALKYCRTNKTSLVYWKKFLKKLDSIKKKYWKGLVLECQNKELESSKYFLEAASAASKSKWSKNHPLAIVSYEKVAKIYRKNDRREDAAKIYSKLVSAWNLPGASPKWFRLSYHKFVIKKINDFLWAARYSAMIGDYKNATTHTFSAFNIIENILRRYDSIYASYYMIEDINLFKIEAYYLLATRIYVEKKQFTKSIMYLERALNVPNLTDEWFERLVWYLGYTRYLNGDINDSINTWEYLLTYGNKISNRSKLYFWLAYANHQNGSFGHTIRYLHKLEEDYPLNFYTVVGADIGKLHDKSYLEKLLYNPRLLRNELINSTPSRAMTFREHKIIEIFLARSELLLYAGLKEWASYGNISIYSNATHNFSLDQNPDDYIYLSRYFYAVGDHYRSISLTSNLSNIFDDFWETWPEQIHIYFPKDYVSIYQKESKKNAVDLTLLYSLTRQESSFNPNAQSFADAYGLMQLLKPTAKRVAKVSSIKWNGDEKTLLEPKTNIRFGSAYSKLLKLRYKNNTPAMIAAYNAGEFAVDSWVKRRNNQNPLEWIELIPFSETRNYVKNVMRNMYIYDFLK